MRLNSPQIHLFQVFYILFYPHDKEYCNIIKPIAIFTKFFLPRNFITNTEVSPNNIRKLDILHIPLWKLKEANIIFDLLSRKKTSSEKYHSVFHEINLKYHLPSCVPV